MIENALIPVGGYGERLKRSGFSRNFDTKGLIELSPGLTLFEDVLSKVRDSGNIRRVIIATRIELHERLIAIARRVDIDHVFFFDDGKTRVSNLPYYCRSALKEDPFFIIAGHAPFTTEHLRRMETTRRDDREEVCTLYPSNRIKQMRTVVGKDGFISSILLDLEDTSVREGTSVVETPFLLTPEIIKQVSDHEFSRCFGFYLQERMRKGTPLRGVQADFPIEADYGDEMRDTLHFFNKADPADSQMVYAK